MFTVIETPDDKIIGLARLPSNRDALLCIRLGTAANGQADASKHTAHKVRQNCMDVQYFAQGKIQVVAN